MAKGVPTGVKIISVLYYIGAVFSLIAGIVAFAGGAFFTTVLPKFIAGIAAIAGIVFIILAVLGFFIARGLWKGQNWARILAIVFAILGVISALIAIISGGYQGIVSLVINAIIGYYLWFNKGVKAAF